MHERVAIGRGRIEVDGPCVGIGEAYERRRRGSEGGSGVGDAFVSRRHDVLVWIPIPHVGLGRLFVGYVGEAGIEPGVAYRYDAEAGRLVECDAKGGP